MESISIIKGATTVKKEAKKVQRQKSFFFLHKYHMLLFSALGVVKGMTPATLMVSDLLVQFVKPSSCSSPLCRARGFSKGNLNQISLKSEKLQIEGLRLKVERGF